jgi:DNA-directed RNA polymerase subunit H (RpoH/RPB5)
MSLCPNILQVLRYRGLRAKPKVYVCKGTPTKNKSQQHVFNIYELIHEEDWMKPGCEVVALLIDIDAGVKIGKKSLLKLVMHNSKVKHVIVLTTDISHPAEKAVADITTKRIEIIRRHEIAWDKPEYCLVPHYELLTYDQVIEFEKSRQVKRENLPKMLSNDQMAIVHGFCVGDVVHCVEPDTYRFVIFSSQKPKKASC